MEIQTEVVIVGAGPSGLAISACLNVKGIPNIVLEREDCCASLWKNRAYDRLKLHLAKEFCQLPHLPFPSNVPKYVPRNQLIGYLDDYASIFHVNPFYCRRVVSGFFDINREKWVVEANNSLNGTTETFTSRFLVVATGENSEGVIPEIQGLDGYAGVAMHASHYRNGGHFFNCDVLVVGSGNSGMEISFDLANWGAKPSIVVRSPLHVLTKELVYFGMKLLQFLPVNIVDRLVLTLSEFWHGNLAKYGLKRPENGPFLLKALTGRSPVIDVGTISKIKNGEIKVMPGIDSIDEFSVKFSSGVVKDFDAIIFATGYKSTVGKWLKDDARLFNNDGMPKKKKPDHWKGEDGLYCVGFGSAGLLGISKDAMMVAEDISFIRN